MRPLFFLLPIKTTNIVKMVYFIYLLNLVCILSKKRLGYMHLCIIRPLAIEGQYCVITHPLNCIIHIGHRESGQGGLEAVKQRPAPREHLHQALGTNKSYLINTNAIQWLTDTDSERQKGNIPTTLWWTSSFFHGIQKSSHDRTVDLSECISRDR